MKHCQGQDIRPTFPHLKKSKRMRDSVRALHPRHAISKRKSVTLYVLK